MYNRRFDSGRAVVVGLLGAFVVGCGPFASAKAANDKPNRLYLVRKIFVENVPDTVNQEKRIEQFLKRELERYGFSITGDRTSADAILEGVIDLELTLDGDASNPPDKAIYRFQLRHSSNEIVWKGGVKITVESAFADCNEPAARKIAEKIASDWRKSAGKAGLR